MSVQPVSIQRKSDTRGSLAVLERARDIPFDIARLYWVSGVPADTPRGFHAHHATRQLAMCVAGSCRLLLVAPDGTENWAELAAQGPAIPIEPLVWHEMHDFSADCVLLVLADRGYDEADYIRDRAKWEDICRG